MIDIQLNYFVNKIQYIFNIPFHSKAPNTLTIELHVVDMTEK